MWKTITQTILQKSVFSFHAKVYFWGHRKVLEFPLLPLLGLESNHSGVLSFIAYFLISVVRPALMSARFRSHCSVSSYPVFKNPCHLTLNSELKFKATHKLVQPRHVIPETLHLATETEEKKGECPTVPHESRELSPGDRVGVLAVKVDVVRKAILEWRSGTGHCD